MPSRLILTQRNLRACPREHRAVVLDGISSISMKLCQFKGSTPKLKKTNWFLFFVSAAGSVNLIDGLSINSGKYTTVFLDFSIHLNI